MQAAVAAPQDLLLQAGEAGTMAEEEEHIATAEAEEEEAVLPFYILVLLYYNMCREAQEVMVVALDLQWAAVAVVPLAALVAQVARQRAVQVAVATEVWLVIMVEAQAAVELVVQAEAVVLIAAAEGMVAVAGDMADPEVTTEPQAATAVTVGVLVMAVPEEVLVQEALLDPAQAVLDMPTVAMVGV